MGIGLDYDPATNPIHHKNQCFAAALKALFERYPAPTDGHTFRWRKAALEDAGYGRILTLQNASERGHYKVPHEEFLALVALIYD